MGSASRIGSTAIFNSSGSSDWLIVEYPEKTITIKNAAAAIKQRVL
jgi:hypothetical protein